MEMEKMKKTLETKILEEVTPEDICDFWAEMVNGYVKVDHTHTGKVSLECFDGFDVYDSIEDAAKDCAYTIVEWVVDGHDFALEWLEENGIELDAVAETASAPNCDFERVEPTYTGGGIYIFTGKLTNGNYFLACDDMYDVRILNADPDADWEESQYEDWQIEHLVEDLSSADAIEFFREMLIWVNANLPNGNYSWDDIDHMLEEVTELTEREEAKKVQPYKPEDPKMVYCATLYRLGHKLEVFCDSKEEAEERIMAEFERGYKNRNGVSPWEVNRGNGLTTADIAMADIKIREIVLGVTEWKMDR